MLTITNFDAYFYVCLKKEHNVGAKFCSVIQNHISVSIYFYNITHTYQVKSALKCSSTVAKLSNALLETTFSLKRKVFQVRILN